MSAQPLVLPRSSWDAALRIGVLYQAGMHWYLEGAGWVVCEEPAPTNHAPAAPLNQASLCESLGDACR
jgi:hypothetical protein